MHRHRFIRRRVAGWLAALTAVATFAVGVPSASAQTTLHVPNFPTSGGSSELSTVSGITVHESIAADLRAMLTAASGAGHTLSGVGYRSTARQIQLRRQSCGTSPWAIFEASSSQCGSNPIARPGLSNHHYGLAVDFLVGSRFMRTTDAAFTWLSANAHLYGFYNLASEPWHWSVNGR